MTDGFEVDRTPAGKIRVNVISIANLVALLGLLGIAWGSWTTLVSRVDVLTARFEVWQQERTELRGELRELRVRSESSSSRLSVMEGQVTGIVQATERMERKLDTIGQQK